MAQFAFDATVIYWRGPAPFFYAPVPPAEAEEIRRASRLVSYGWGVIPVEATIGEVTFTTSLFPRTAPISSPSRTPSANPAALPPTTRSTSS